MIRWRQIIDKSIPRNDIMEIAWENIPAAWEQDMAALRVYLLFLCGCFEIGRRWLIVVA